MLMKKCEKGVRKTAGRIRVEENDFEEMSLKREHKYLDCVANQKGVECYGKPKGNGTEKNYC
jgi:hypothetical protein